MMAFALLVCLVAPLAVQAQGSSLSAPTLSATVINTTQVNLSWTASTGGTVNHYEVWRSVNNAAYSQIGSPTATSFSDNTLSAGVTYLYKVRAVDNGSLTSNFRPPSCMWSAM
jgi:fibronectin type 3 domain-containing protein